MTVSSCSMKLQYWCKKVMLLCRCMYVSLSIEPQIAAEFELTDLFPNLNLLMHRRSSFNCHTKWEVFRQRRETDLRNSSAMDKKGAKQLDSRECVWGRNLQSLNAAPCTPALFSDTKRHAHTHKHTHTHFPTQAKQIAERFSGDVDICLAGVFSSWLIALLCLCRMQLRASVLPG